MALRKKNIIGQKILRENFLGYNTKTVTPIELLAHFHSEPNITPYATFRLNLIFFFALPIRPVKDWIVIFGNNGTRTRRDALTGLITFCLTRNTEVKTPHISESSVQKP